MTRLTMGTAPVAADRSPQDSDPEAAAFNAQTARLLHREALRRAAQDINTASGPGLEHVLERISAEVTAEAYQRIQKNEPDADHPLPARPDMPARVQIISPGPKGS